ncbi:MAG: permease prefix domain 1-containing protein [Planctomycetota bacterium]
MSEQMNSEEFERYMHLLGTLLRIGRQQRAALSDELRSHLEERVRELTAAGAEPGKAVSTALAEFGDAAALAARFSAAYHIRQRRWIMRATIFSCACVLITIGLVMALWPEGAGGPGGQMVQAQQDPFGAEEFVPVSPSASKPAKRSADEPTSSAGSIANQQTQQLLSKLITVEFVETPLSDVLEYLTDAAGIQYHVKKRALDETGLSLDVPVSFNLKNVPADMVLRLAFDQHGLAYRLENGVVIVTTPEEAETALEIRVYRVADLLPKDEPQATAGASPLDYAESEPMAAQGAQDLVSLITQTVAPESWSDVGGMASIRLYRGALVISQTAETHQKISSLLEDLRAAIKTEQ